MAERIQRRRTKGWRMPDGAVYVGRPTPWGNPFCIGSNQRMVYVHDARRVWLELPRSHSSMAEARRKAVELFALHTGPMGHYEIDVDEARERLAGRDLACWCPLGQPCHGDVLLEIANGGARG